jgi:hypothetical protein
MHWPRSPAAAEVEVACHRSLPFRAHFCSLVEAIFAFYHVGTFLPGRVELSTFAFSTTFYHDMET